MIRNEIFGPMHVNQARNHCTLPKISNPTELASSGTFPAQGPQP